MSAPTISELPELPTFPDDQPRVFFPALLAYLLALDTFRSELTTLAAYLESLDTSGGSGGGTTITETFQWAVANTDADSHTVTSADIFRHLRFTNDVAAELLIPLDGGHGFEIGDSLRLTQLGDGQVTITASSPTIILNSLSGALTTSGAGAVAELTYIGSNEWDAFGDLLSNAMLSSGDMTDGDDQILLSGDMTDGDDIEMTSGV